jgi:hypothetical protein
MWILHSNVDRYMFAPLYILLRNLIFATFYFVFWVHELN